LTKLEIFVNLLLKALLQFRLGGGKTNNEKGGMAMDGLAKILGVALFLALVYFALHSIFDGAINLVEVNVIKKVNPSYKTKFELKEVEKIRKTELARREEEVRQREMELEHAEDLKERQISALINTRKIENNLKEKGYGFNVVDSYILDNYIWVCGNLYIRDLEGERNYPAIAISENGGSDYKLLKIFEEFNKFSVHSTIYFPEKNIGYVEIYGAEYKGYPTASIIYKTFNAGHNWNMFLDTTNLRLSGGYIRRIRAVKQKISLIVSFQREGSLELIESNDGGKTWIYRRDNIDIAKTSDKGETWEVTKKGG
jgi:hypothetical protein